jgi:parallel beta-helix repeat protein
MYSIDNGLTNISLNTTNNKNFNGTLNAPIDGQYAFKVYANDTNGNTNYTEKVIFTVTTGNIISQCGTLNSSGTYTLNQSITSIGSCLNITASNVSIDCNGSSITYNTGGNSGMVGINASTTAYTNLSIKNCFITKSSAAGTDGYGIYLNSTSNSVIFNNTIRTNGTANNYGIYISINSVGNNITQNIIFSTGSTINNIGVYLSKGATNTTVSFNNISANGAATDYGIYVIGNTTSYNNNNLFSYNNITTGGTGANNYGIYLTANVSYNNITGNNIITSGTTTNHGIYFLGAAGVPVNNNTIFNNKILARGIAAAVTNYGIYIQNNANFNNIINNNVSTNGTTNNWGIYLVGTNALAVNSNLISSNNITTNGIGPSNYGIYFITNVSYNNITGNSIFTNGTTTNHGIYIYGDTATTPTNNCKQYNTSLWNSCSNKQLWNLS